MGECGGCDACVDRGERIYIVYVYVYIYICICVEVDVYIYIMCMKICVYIYRLYGMGKYATTLGPGGKSHGVNMNM